MRAGQMRDRVTFKTNVVTADGMGGQSTSWVEITTVSGYLKHLRGSETVEGDRTQAVGQSILRVRSSAVMRTVTEADIATISDVDYQIRNIENYDRRDRTVEMTLERGVVK